MRGQTECVTHNRPIMRGTTPDGDVILYRPDCGLWSCPHCAHANKRRWAARVAHGIDVYRSMELDDWVFVTLTAHEDRRTFAGSMNDLWDAWPRLRTARRKVADGKILYARVPEAHEDGTLHLHLLTRPHMGKKWWKDNARKRGLGYIVDERPIYDSGGAAGYVSKYIAKGLNERNWPPQLRRITTSANWPELPPLHEGPEIEVDDWRPLLTIMSSSELSDLISADEGVNVRVVGKPWTRAIIE